MESWQSDFEWLKIQHWIKEKFNREKLPDLNAVLFLIGMQELGQIRSNFTKEEKQDLMHIAVCRLLSDEGYFEFAGKDADGWPHWKVVRPITTKGLKNQEDLLKAKAIRYFREMEEE